MWMWTVIDKGICIIKSNNEFDAVAAIAATATECIHLNLVDAAAHESNVCFFFVFRSCDLYIQMNDETDFIIKTRWRFQSSRILSPIVAPPI